MGSDGATVVDFFDRRRKDVVLVNQQTWVMAKVASGPGGLYYTVVFLFFLF